MTLNMGNHGSRRKTKSTLPLAQKMAHQWRQFAHLATADPNQAHSSLLIRFLYLHFRSTSAHHPSIRAQAAPHQRSLRVS